MLGGTITTTSSCCSVVVGGCSFANANIDECIAEGIVRNTNDLVTLVALDHVNKLFHSFAAIKLKTLRLELGGFGVKWLTERSESVDCDGIAAQQGIDACVIGASGTGKTCIAKRFIGKPFLESQESTIGVDFWITKAPVRGSSVKLQIWDTSGKGRYRSFWSCRSAVILIVYDITRLSSLNSLTVRIAEIRGFNHVGKLLLCGNKADLFDSRQSSATASVASAETIVTYSQGLEFAKANHCDGFVEVSAKTMRNIPQLLTALGLLALEGAPSPVEEKKKSHKPECALA